MRRPLKMTIDIKEILRLHCCGLSIREIAQKTGVPRTSVSRYLQRAKAEDIHWDKIKTLARAEVSQMFAVCGKETERQASLDCPAIVQEMKAYRLTIEQAYKRYLDRVTKSGIKPYGRSKFFACIAEYRQAHTISKVSLAIDWIMGDACQIDFCGDTLKIYDREAQKWITVYFFAGILCYSGYCFLRAVLDQTRETWLRMMSEMISCFGGAPKQLILDNAKAGVLKADRYSPRLAPEVVAFGKYYNISIEATYPVSPTHKGAVENSVGLLQRKIIAPRRGMTYFSIEDLNRDIAKELEEFNRTPMKNSPHSRLDYFIREAQVLQAIPEEPFTVGTRYRTYTANKSACISILGHQYSVPREYRNQKVLVCITVNNEMLIRDPGTMKELGRHHYYGEQMAEQRTHILPEHQGVHSVYSKEQLDRLMKWAGDVDQEVYRFCSEMLKNLESNASIALRQRKMFGIRKLKDQYGVEKLVWGCSLALALHKVNLEDLDTLLAEQVGIEQASNGGSTDEEKEALPLLRLVPELNRVIEKKRRKNNG